MKFKVQFVVSRSDNRQISMECEYVAPDPLLSIAEMMCQCTDDLRRDLERQGPFFRNCLIVITEFKQMDDNENSG